MCAPLDVPRQAPVATRAAPAGARCVACGHKRKNGDGKTHYFSQCKVVLGRIQCRAALPENHNFTRAHRAETASVRASRRKLTYSFLSILYRF